MKQDSIGILSHHPNRKLASIFRALYKDLILQIRHFEKCVVSGIVYDVKAGNENEILVRMNCIVMGNLAKKSDSLDERGICGRIVFAEKSRHIPIYSWY